MSESDAPSLAPASSPRTSSISPARLREAGLPVGPGAVLDALAAVQAAGIGDRDDFYTTLHAVFIKKHEHASCSIRRSAFSGNAEAFSKN